MKSLSHFLACIGALGLLTVGCERHDFEKTKILHLEHGGEHHEGDHPEGDHKEGHEKDHKKGEDHAGEGEHAKGEKADKGEEKPAKEEGRDTGI